MTTTQQDAQVEAASGKAEARFAEHSPVMAAIIDRAIAMYRFDTPEDRSRAHEVARIVARNTALSTASVPPQVVDTGEVQLRAAV